MTSGRTIAVALILGVAAGCQPRPVELGFWIDDISYRSPRIGEPVTGAELTTIDRVAREEIAQAFKDFDVTITANSNARFRVAVLAELRDQRLLRQGTYAGESRAIAGFGGSGAVNFEYVANGAMIFSPQDAGRETVIEALGRGIGRVAIHEFLHQLLPKQPIHDSRDGRSYEGNSPAMVEGYFGELHWDIAAPWLQRRLKPR